MTYVLIISAEDGRHPHVFADRDAMLEELKAQLGHEPRLIEGADTQSWVDDWGRRIVLERRPDNWTEAMEEDFAEGFDNMECELPLTQAQREALLAMGVTL